MKRPYYDELDRFWMLTDTLFGDLLRLKLKIKKFLRAINDAIKILKSGLWKTQ